MQLTIIIVMIFPNRLDIHIHKLHDLNFCRLYPEDVKLSDMMASSAAVISSNMGIYQVNMDAIRDIQIILGINMGRCLIAQPFHRRDTSCYFLSNNVS